MFDVSYATEKLGASGDPIPVPAAFDAKGQLGPLLRFASGAKVPNGFGYLNAEGAVDEQQSAELWITCRMTHVFSLAHMLGIPGAEELAAHGVRALRGAFHDDEFGGWYSAVATGLGGSGTAEVVDDGKAAYAHAFVLLAANSALAAGIAGAEELLAEALRVQDEHWYDAEAGLVRESWDRRFTVSEEYRGINANMHTVEAYLAVADHLADRELLDRAVNILGFVARTAENSAWRIPEHYSVNWEPLPDYNRDQPAHPFRPYGITPGHGLEWARLMLQARASLLAAGEEAPEWMLPAAVNLYSTALKDAWQVDGSEGFVYTTDPAGNPVVRQRMHWVLNEAVGANLVLQRVLAAEPGSPFARVAEQLPEQLERWGQYAQEYFLEAPGRWVHELNPDNSPGTQTWPGKPDAYHAAQMLLLPYLPATPSFAAALAASPASGR